MRLEGIMTVTDLPDFLVTFNHMPMRGIWLHILKDPILSGPVHMWGIC